MEIDGWIGGQTNGRRTDGWVVFGRLVGWLCKA